MAYPLPLRPTLFSLLSAVHDIIKGEDVGEIKLVIAKKANEIRAACSKEGGREEYTESGREIKK